MCRIAGIVCQSNSHKNAGDLTLMLDSMAHGGPDGHGIYSDGPLSIGNRRLSIIDLSKAGSQPMISSDSNLVITYNGEIYNFKILRDKLEAIGFLFISKSDTEVILFAYQAWGTKSFELFEGIFAFALYDRKLKECFLVRDHIGVKPLYYHLSVDKLIFSSEVRAFKSVNPDWPEEQDWKVLFLAFGSIPHPLTTLSDVYQLPPGSYLKLDLGDFSHRIVCYYSDTPKDYLNAHDTEVLKMMQFAIQAAITKNLMSDVPLGVFLSGGIDSSLLLTIADRLKSGISSVSVNFDEGSYDEYHYQKLALEGTTNVDHTSHRITEQMFWDSLGDIWNAMDQPSIDGVNSYFIAKCAKKDGLKVVLSGLGADEIFGGYPSFNRIKWVRILRRMPFKRVVGRVVGWKKHAYRRMMFLNLPGVTGDYLFLRGIHTPDDIASILSIPEETVWKVLSKVSLAMNSNIDDAKYVSDMEAKIYMSNQLLKDVDFMSMWHGLEVRVPFLDIDLISKVGAVRPSNRHKDGWPKYLLTASNEHILSPKIIFRKKLGFTFPMEKWMRTSKERFKSLVKLDKSALKLIHAFEKGRDHWSKYWSLAVLQNFSDN